VRFFPPHPFPAWRLPDLQGVEQALARWWSGGTALVAIGHGDCATTRLALPFVDRLHRRRGPGREVVVVLQDPPSDAKALAEELDLQVPILLEADPYPLAAELELRTVPTLLLVDGQGRVAAACEGFRRDDLESFGARLGLAGPLFTAADAVPLQKPG
jgi:hypothetical protein